MNPSTNDQDTHLRLSHRPATSEAHYSSSVLLLWPSPQLPLLPVLLLLQPAIRFSTPPRQQPPGITGKSALQGMVERKGGMQHCALLAFFPFLFLYFNQVQHNAKMYTCTREAKKRPQTPQENTTTSLK